MLSFNGIARIPFTFLNSLGIDFYPNLLEKADIYLFHLEDYITINSNINYNSFSSIFFNFFIDFGIIGMVLASSFLGYLCSKLYMKIYENETSSGLISYGLIITLIVNSTSKSIFTMCLMEWH